MSTPSCVRARASAACNWGITAASSGPTGPGGPTALVAIIGLHLAIEYVMSLYLFEWVMIAGWLSHTQPHDYRWLREKLRIGQRAGASAQR